MKMCHRKGRDGEIRLWQRDHKWRAVAPFPDLWRSLGGGRTAKIFLRHSGILLVAHGLYHTARCILQHEAKRRLLACKLLVALMTLVFSTGASLSLMLSNLALRYASAERVPWRVQYRVSPARACLAF